MKAYALAGRDKPKDAYDICYCLEHAPGGPDALGQVWRVQRSEPAVRDAISHLRDKFASIDSFGPVQVAAFYGEVTPGEQELQARRAFELVQRFLVAVDG